MHPAPAGPEASLKPPEELFRARIITFLVGKGLLPPERARMLRGRVHTGFNVHRSRRVAPDQRQDMERLAQYMDQESPGSRPAPLSPVLWRDADRFTH